VSAVPRAWLSNHAAAAVLACLAGLFALTSAVGRGVIEDRLTNPLGESYASLSITLILPVLGIALLPVALHDRVDPSMTLVARSLGWIRAAWWLAGVVVVSAALAPVQPLTGSAQLGIDIGLLTGLSTLALCALGLGPALTVPLLVLVPHLARRTGAPPRWWSVLDTPHHCVTGAVAAGLSVAGLLTYSRVGPRSRPDLSGDGVD
jgi:hypothetical protein